MSTLVVEVNAEQEEVLKTLFDYMNIHFQKVGDDDFWDDLSPAVKARIGQGKADVEAGRFSPAHQIIDQLMGNQ